MSSNELHVIANRTINESTRGFVVMFVFVTMALRPNIVTQFDWLAQYNSLALKEVGQAHICS